MSQESERVYTINLGKVWLSPNNQRAKRAINMIKEFTEHHMKTEQIKIDQDLSHAIWERGIRSPPRKIRVKMAKTDDGYVMVSPYQEEEKPKAKKEESKSEPKVELKQENVKQESIDSEKKSQEKPVKKEEKKAEKKEVQSTKKETKKPTKKSK
ncbi:MAG: 50S ribosomal protein L31e [Candidatus Nitrosotenuis sp.]